MIYYRSYSGRVLGGTIYGEILPVLAAIIISLVALIVIPFTLIESKRLSSQMQILKEVLLETFLLMNVRTALILQKIISYHSKRSSS